MLNSDRHRGLTSSQLGGIAGGLAGAALLLAVLVFFLLKRRKRQNQVTEGDERGQLFAPGLNKSMPTSSRRPLFLVSSPEAVPPANVEKPAPVFNSGAGLSASEMQNKTDAQLYAEQYSMGISSTNFSGPLPPSMKMLLPSAPRRAASSASSAPSSIRLVPGPGHGVPNLTINTNVRSEAQWDHVTLSDATPIHNKLLTPEDPFHADDAMSIIGRSPPRSAPVSNPFVDPSSSTSTIGGTLAGGVSAVTEIDVNSQSHTVHLSGSDPTRFRPMPPSFALETAGGKVITMPDRSLSLKSLNLFRGGSKIDKPKFGRANTSASSVKDGIGGGRSGRGSGRSGR